MIYFPQARGVVTIHPALILGHFVQCFLLSTGDMRGSIFYFPTSPWAVWSCAPQKPPCFLKDTHANLMFPDFHAALTPRHLVPQESSQSGKDAADLISPKVKHLWQWLRGAVSFPDKLLPQELAVIKSCLRLFLPCSMKHTAYHSSFKMSDTRN